MSEEAYQEDSFQNDSFQTEIEIPPDKVIIVSLGIGIILKE